MDLGRLLSPVRFIDLVLETSTFVDANFGTLKFDRLQGWLAALDPTLT